MAISASSQLDLSTVWFLNDLHDQWCCKQKSEQLVAVNVYEQHTFPIWLTKWNCTSKC